MRFQVAVFFTSSKPIWANDAKNGKFSILSERLLTLAFKVCLREFLKSICLAPGKINRLFKWKLSTR
jgi:hypothetical protein